MVSRTMRLNSVHYFEGSATLAGNCVCIYIYIYMYLCVGVDDWLCSRHSCHTCNQAATMMCVFCPISYCDQHADGNIKTRSFTVGTFRVRHRICVAHKNMPPSTVKAERRHFSKLKAGKVCAICGVHNFNVLDFINGIN